MDISIKNAYKNLRKVQQNFLGFPSHIDIKYFKEIYPFLEITINNIGDPFKKGLSKISSQTIEQKVINFFAELYHLPKNYWGYVTNGGTEGNMYGLFLARELHPNGVLFYSKDTHYSIKKITRLLKLKSVLVESLKNGEIDYDDFEKKIKKHAKQTAIVLCNIGTTMKGAIDDIPKIAKICNKNSINHYIHADCALFGFILPFLDHAPKFDFLTDIQSLSVSGHKFIGSPIPCGVVLTKKELVDKISQEQVEYIGNSDTTISGSRNGHTPIFIWHLINHFGVSGYKKMAKQCLKNTDYAIEKFKEIKWAAWKNPYSNIVVIKRPSDKIINKWQLATQGDISHIICMRHVSEEKINALCLDLKQEQNN